MSKVEAFERKAEGAAPGEASVFRELRAEVKRVIDSPDFMVPERARKFLAYITEEALAGRADRIKAYSIATDVLGRDTSFDSQTDPVVRIEAGRVRRALERYYLTAGIDDPIVITIPKGGYVPNFRWRDRGPIAPPRVTVADEPQASPPRPPVRIRLAHVAMAVLFLGILASSLFALFARHERNPASTAAYGKSAPPDVPRLLVVPFADLSGTENSAIIARGLTDEVVGQIAKFKEIVVIVSGPPGTAGAEAPHRGASPFELQGSVRVEGDKLRLSARLVDTTDDSVLWAESYDETLRVQELLESQADIARQVATAVAQPYGIIFHAAAAQVVHSPPNDWEAYACTLAYYAYRTDLKPETRASVEQCLKHTTEKFPTYATAWALLSLIYLDEMRFRQRIDAGPSPPLQSALAAARRAVDLEPENVRGLQAYMTALFFQQEVDAALKVGAQAAAINPNDTELLGEYGMRLALSGQWARGKGLMLQALDRNTGPQGYFESVVALCYYMQSDYPTAEAWIRKADLQASPMYHLIGAAIYGQLGRTREAGLERDWILSKAPELLTDLPETLRTRNMRDEDKARFVDGLRRAGLSTASY